MNDRLVFFALNNGHILFIPQPAKQVKFSLTRPIFLEALTPLSRAFQ